MVRLSVPSVRDARQSSSRPSTTSSPTTSLPDAPAPSCSRARWPTICWFVVGAIYHEACLCWHSRNAASASATTFCSSVCLGNFLMVIHSARPQAAGTTQNNPLKTNGPKNPDLSKRLRGAAFGFRNLINYTTRALLKTAGFRPQRHFNYKELVFM